MAGKLGVKSHQYPWCWTHTGTEASWCVCMVPLGQWSTRACPARELVGRCPPWLASSHLSHMCSMATKITPPIPWERWSFYRMVPYASFKCISFINHDLLKLWRVFIYLAEFPSCCLLCCAVMLWKDGWSFHFVDFIFFFSQGIPPFPCSSDLICISVQKF